MQKNKDMKEIAFKINGPITTPASPTAQSTANAPKQLSPALIIAKFIDDQDVREATKSVYSRSLTQFFKWIASNDLQLGQLTQNDLTRYRGDALAQGKSSLTVATYITAVRLFYVWLEAQKIYPNVARNVKCPRVSKRFRKQPLSPEQAADVLGACESDRDRAIVNLLLRTGIRTVEAARADICDIQYKGGRRVLLIQGKGRDDKDNFVILTDKAFAPIESYLKNRGAKSPEPLFVSNARNSPGKRLTTRSISGTVKKTLRAIGIDQKEFTAHSLRHTAAVGVLKASGSFEMVQMMLRHANPATTQIYTGTIADQRRLEKNGEGCLDQLY